MEYLELFFWPFLAAAILALISSPLGVFVVWQKQSYFGATIAHAAILGVSFALILNTPITFTTVMISLMIGSTIFYLSRHTNLSNDTLLGILAHSTLALGMVMIALQNNNQIDVMALLFGDLLNIDQTDTYLLLVCLALVFVFFKFYWRSMLNITFNTELAQVEGTPVARVQLMFVLLLSFMIALTMKMVGVLLITSMLIIPAAAARKLSATPQQMLFWTGIISLLSVVFGILGSIQYDIPTGASIVLASSIIFVMLQLKPQASHI